MVIPFKMACKLLRDNVLSFWSVFVLHLVLLAYLGQEPQASYSGLTAG